MYDIIYSLSRMEDGRKLLATEIQACLNAELTQEAFKHSQSKPWPADAPYSTRRNSSLQVRSFQFINVNSYHEPSIILRASLWFAKVAKCK